MVCVCVCVEFGVLSVVWQSGIREEYVEEKLPEHLTYVGLRV